MSKPLATLAAIAPLAFASAAAEEQQFLFLLEPAYVQEAGEWQAGALVALDPEDEISLAGAGEFEYGLSDRMQLHAEIPFQDGDGGGGLGDARFGLSYSPIGESDARPQLRLTLEAIAPTGDAGLGGDAWGWEISAAASKAIGESLHAHAAVEYERIDGAIDEGEEVDEREWEAGVGLAARVAPAWTLTAELVRSREETRTLAGDEVDYATEAALGLSFALGEGVEFGIAAAHADGDGGRNSALFQILAEW